MSQRSCRPVYVVLGILLFAVPLAASPVAGAERGSEARAGRGGPPELPGPPEGVGLDRSLARGLARLDERLELGTFPDGSPLWPARMAAAIEHLLGEAGGEGKLTDGDLLRRLAVELRHLGAERGLGGPPEERGPSAEPPVRERAQRLSQALETVRLLHEKLDRTEAGRTPEHRLAPRAAPVNDDCDSAQVIGTGTFSGSTSQATNDGSASCGSSSSSPDVWYAFTAPADGTYTFDTFGSSYDTVLSLHTGCPGGGGPSEEIACSDDAGGTLQSKLTHAMTEGEEVWVRVSGFAGSAGSYTLNVFEVGGISGTVTRRDTGEPVAGVSVGIYNDFGWFVAQTTSASDGSYLVTLPSGTYYLLSWSSELIDQLYDGIPCPFFVFCWPENGTPVTVGTGITAGIDFALAPAATLSGALSDAATGAPLQGFVYLYGATGSFLTSFFTGSGGTYEFQGLPAGKYHVQGNAWGYRSELYDDIPCGSSCDPTTGTQIAVPEGATVTGIDFDLDLNPAIRGTLTEEGSGDPIWGADVVLYNSAGSWVWSTWTSSSGSYQLSDIDPGTYFVRTFSSFHHDKLYDDIPCQPSCTVTAGTAVEAEVGSDATGIDFVLVPFGKVAGTVTEAGTGAPLGSVIVQVHDAGGSSVGWFWTSSDGSYLARGLRTGTYYVRTGSSTHENEVFDDVVCEPSCEVTSGTPVATTDGTTTSGIDFALRRRGSIAGRVTHSISGTPISGAGIGAYNPAADVFRFSFTASDGTYELTGMASGNAHVTASRSGYRSELYDGIPCTWDCDIWSGAGTPVAVQPETTTSGIDFALDRLGFVEGRVTALDSGLALASEMSLLDPSGSTVAWAWTSGGNFKFENLQPGSYYVKTDTSWFSSAYQDELFDDVPCDPTCELSLGTQLPVQLNGGVVGVDFVLGLCPVGSYNDLVGVHILSTYAAEACERVSAVGVTVGSGADVTFKAGRRVVLGDGFRIEAGGRFRAVIEPAWGEH